MTDDQQYHEMYPAEFDDAYLAASGAYMGAKAATGSHQGALAAAVEEAFNAGVRVGRSRD